MILKDRINKFDAFLTKVGKVSGALGLCESIRTAAKVCFEGIDEQLDAMRDTDPDSPSYGKKVADYNTIHRMRFHDIPLAKFHAKKRNEEVMNEAREGEAWVETKEEIECAKKFKRVCDEFAVYGPDLTIRPIDKTSGVLVKFGKDVGEVYTYMDDHCLGSPGYNPVISAKLLDSTGRETFYAFDAPFGDRDEHYTLAARQIAKLMNEA